MTGDKKRTNEILLTMLNHANSNNREQLNDYIKTLTRNDFQLLKDFGVNLVESCVLADEIFEKHSTKQEVR